MSDLIVYRSARDSNDVAIEYRDVRSVDGKAVERRGERALQVLTNGILVPKRIVLDFCSTSATRRTDRRRLP